MAGGEDDMTVFDLAFAAFALYWASLAGRFGGIFCLAIAVFLNGCRLSHPWSLPSPLVLRSLLYPLISGPGA